MAFVDVLEAFDDDEAIEVVVQPTPMNRDHRLGLLGRVDDFVYSIAFVMERDRAKILSAHFASEHERRLYLRQDWPQPQTWVPAPPPRDEEHIRRAAEADREVAIIWREWVQPVPMIRQRRFRMGLTVPAFATMFSLSAKLVWECESGERPLNEAEREYFGPVASWPEAIAWMLARRPKPGRPDIEQPAPFALDDIHPPSNN